MRSLFKVSLLLALAAFHIPAAVAAAPGRAAAITRTLWEGQVAYRLSDGRTEAVVVPAWGRIIRYGFVQGPNVLWTAPALRPGAGYSNLGGGKTWPAPQSDWPQFTGGLYPPAPSWDGAPLAGQIVQSATPGRSHLRLTSRIWQGLGVRLILEFGLSEGGALEISQTFDKVAGEPRRMSLWQVAQVPHPDAAFLPLSPASAYRNGFFWFFGGPKPDYAGAATVVSPTLLRVRPAGVQYKVGVDAPAPILATVKDGVAFVMRADAPPAGSQALYPDGADGAGFPAEFYSQSGPPVYSEMELLSPLAVLRRGDRMRASVRWSLHRLSSPDALSAQTQAEVARLLNNGG